MDKPISSPHILMLLENHIYPMDVRVKPHAESLIENGYMVTVISPGGKEFAKHEIVNGVNVYRYSSIFAGTTPVSYLAEFFIATFFLTIMTLWVWARFGMDIVLLYNPPDILFIAAFLPKLLGKTVLFDIRDLSPELYKAKFKKVNPVVVRFLLWMEKLSCQLANHIVTVNESYFHIIQERDAIPQSQISIIRQGPDPEKIKTTSQDSELRIRAKTIIGYLGSMARERGVGHLLSALRHLDQDLGYKDWLCVLVGRPDPSQNLDQLISEFGIADRVIFTGFLTQEQWVPILSTTDICVDPGPLNEINKISTTNKLMDYMALGKPSVVFSLPERHFTAGDAALYATPNDEMELARKIALLIESPELRTKLGSTGRKLVEDVLGWPHQKQRLLALFAQLAQNNIYSSGK